MYIVPTFLVNPAYPSTTRKQVGTCLRVVLGTPGERAAAMHHPSIRIAAAGLLWSLLLAPVLPAEKAAEKRPDLKGIPPGAKPKGNLKPFEYVDANIPFYAPGRRSKRPGADGWNKMQLPLDPAESMKHIVVPEGFEVQLFAAEPDIHRPITMAWDERGRLWIAESVDYPNDLQPPGKGHDRIVILEDTKGTGRADKFTVFADKLSIPTSIAFANGGVIVHQAPDTLFLKSTKGDDHANVREVLFTGWRTHDTHAGPSNLHYGLDNWFYGMVGYSGFRGKVGGESHQFAQGFYRFKVQDAKVSKLEFLRSTSNNSWGLGFNEQGDLFGSTANGNPSVFMSIPNRYYESVRGWSSTVLPMICDSAAIHPITDKVRQVDWHGLYSAAAGHAVYTARAFPKEYWNRAAFVCDPCGHLVGMFQLEPRGSDFVTRNRGSFLASDDEWTAPIMAEVGPDGALWVIDWYNYIVQHNPTPTGFKTGKGGAYLTPLRDKTHGRIYRIAWKKAKPYQPKRLDNASPQQLVAALRNDNLFWRLTAQRLLVERQEPDVIRELFKLVENRSVDALGHNPGALHALWTMHERSAESKEVDGQLKTYLRKSSVALKSIAEIAFDHPAAPVRRAAVQMTCDFFNDPSLAPLVATRGVTDHDAQVRLASLLILSEANVRSWSYDFELYRGTLLNDVAAKIAPRIVSAMTDKADFGDPLMFHAATCAAAAYDLPFLKQLVIHPSKQPAHAKLQEIAARVAEHYARGNPRDSINSLLHDLESADKDTADSIVVGLARGWPRVRYPKVLDDASEKALGKLVVSLPPRSRGSLATLARLWRISAFDQYSAQWTASLLASLRNGTASEQTRIDAASELIDLRKRDVETVRSILQCITPRTSPELTSGLVGAVRRSEATEVGALLVQALPSLTPRARKDAVAALLGRTEWARALLAGVGQGKVELSELSADQMQSLASHPSQAIAAEASKLLARRGGLPDADRQKIIDTLEPQVLKGGDIGHGKEVFTKNCAKCHMHGSEGARIGPDLTGMWVRPRREMLIDILDPSRSVEGNYRQYSVATNDGRVMFGLLASESKTAIELLDAEGKTHVVQRGDIEELVASKKSLMPDGFEKQMSPAELADLLAFLTQRGKYLPLDVRKVATIGSTQGMFYSKDSRAERLVFSSWGLKTFEGVPFQLVDPRDGTIPNVVLLYGPQGAYPPHMPRSVRLPVGAPAKAIHFLSGVSGWGYSGQADFRPTVSMIVRLHYEDGKMEDHPLRNGVHFADYIRRIDVPGSKFAFDLAGRQIRYLAIPPARDATISEIEFIKGPDRTAPVVMAATIESP
jgi:putative membrane-bound dehydrogenase-like protein